MNNTQKVKLSTPRYQQIAADIASKIVEGNYKIGEKIYARSSLASLYGVSPETARRAICVLVDLNIVETEKCSGVIIKSYENAAKFVKQYQDVLTIGDIKQSMMDSVERQKKEMENLNMHINELLAKTEHFRSVNPFMPYQILISSKANFINKSVGEINFWQNTGATIIAIKRGENMLISPGPYAIFCEGDTIYFFGDEGSLQRVSNYLYP